MASSFLAIRLLITLALSAPLFFTLSSGKSFVYDPFTDKPNMVNHGGPMLNGTVCLALMWYGNCGKEIKNTMRNFIKSLGVGGRREPRVSTWWKMVESYQSLMPNAPRGRPPKIRVRVVKQVTGNGYNQGKVLTLQGHIPKLIEQVTKGDRNIIPVIIAARDVTIQGLCHGKCSDHWLAEVDEKNKRPYIVVGNPETECPGECAWPFYPSNSGPKGPLLKPPSGNMAADAMVVSFAGALADTVVNPMFTGIYHENKRLELGPAAVCKGIFGPGACPGNPGRVLTNKRRRSHFNAHGHNNKRFLLPALWNPKTKSCWTPGSK